MGDLGNGIENRSLLQIKLGATIIFWSLVLIIATAVFYFIGFCVYFIFFPIQDRFTDIMFLANNLSSQIPLSLSSFPIIFIIIGIERFIQPYKTLVKAGTKPILISIACMILYYFIPFFVMTLMVLLAILVGEEKFFSDNTLLFIIPFVNIIASYLFISGLLQILVPISDARTRSRLGIAFIIWMALPIFFAFDNMVGIARTIMKSPANPFLSIFFYLMVLVIYLVPLIIAASTMRGIIKRTRDGRLLPAESKIVSETILSKVTRDIGHKRPVLLASALIIAGLLICIPSGFVGFRWDVDGFGNDGNDDMDKFLEYGTMNIYSLDGYMKEGDQMTETIPLEMIFYYLDVSLSWEDEGDYIRWKNTPDTFALTIGIYRDGELIKEETSSSIEESLSLTMDYYTEPVFVDTIIIEWELQSAGDYQKRIGPGVVEKNPDEGNDWDMEILYGYLEEE